MKFRRFVSVFALICSCFYPTPAYATNSLLALEPCFISSQIPCIEEFSGTDSNGVVQIAKPIGIPRTFPLSLAGQTSQPIKNFEWQLMGTKNENGNDRLTLEVMYFPLGAKYCAQGFCSTTTDEIAIRINGSWFDSVHTPIDYENWPAKKSCGSETAPTVCKRGWGADSNYRFQVTLKLPKSFELSHANGEAQDAYIIEENESTSFNRLIFSGRPVPLSFVWWTERNQATVFNQNRADETMNHLNAYIQSTKALQSNWMRDCNYGKGMNFWYNGNLTAFPKWDPLEEVLTIGVASTHLKVDGSINVGTFNVNIPLEVAECLWKVDLRRKIAAYVNITYENQESVNVASTTLGVKGNYLQVSAAGFHYSSPTLSIKLKAPETNTAVVNNLETELMPEKLIPKVKKKIVCQKGKVVKTVIAYKPVCPKGFKKRS